MTDQTKTALAAFKEHVLSVIASTEAKRHSSAVAAIDIDRFLAAHRTELAIKDGTWMGKKEGETTRLYRYTGILGEWSPRPLSLAEVMRRKEQW